MVDPVYHVHVHRVRLETPLWLTCSQNKSELLSARGEMQAHGAVLFSLSGTMLLQLQNSRHFQTAGVGNGNFKAVFPVEKAISSVFQPCGFGLRGFGKYSRHHERILIVGGI